MKYSLALLAALAASSSVSALPLRLITFSPAESLQHAEVEAASLPITAAGKPCHGVKGASGAAAYGPIGALLARLGFAPDHPAGAVLSSAVNADTDSNSESELEVEGEGRKHSLLDEWKAHVEEIFNDAVPIIEGGVVRLVNTHAQEHEGEDELNEVKWWRVAAGGRWEVKSGNGKWRAPRTGERAPMAKSATQSAKIPPQLLDQERPIRHSHSLGREHGRLHHHRHHLQHIAKTLHGRVQKAISNLLPIEAIAFALVIGAGIGSIAHFIFMVLLLSYRRVRYGKTDRAARRAARKARKAAAVAAAAAAADVGKGKGEIRLEGEESLPAYEDGEMAEAQLTEKA